MGGMIALSVGLQLAAALQAASLAKRTGWTAAWSLVAAALTLMVGRRLLSLWEWSETGAYDSLHEGLLVATSALLLAGVSMIGRSALVAAEVAEVVRAAKDQAEQANRAKTVFLANMSHELRTPLNAVIGFAQMIRHEVLGAVGNTRYRDYAAAIEDSGQTLLAAFEDILDVSRIEAGQMGLKDEVVVLADLMDAAGRTVRLEAEAAGIDLAVRCDDGGVCLRGDGRRLRQVLNNLLDNAVKFTPPGGKVELRCRRTGDGGVELVVVDTGIGIAPDDIGRVMAAFGQVEAAYVRSHHGAGLGLPIARSLVELHGGTLSLGGRSAGGTRVVIRLPPERVLAGSAEGIVAGAAHGNAGKIAAAEGVEDAAELGAVTNFRQ